MKFIVEALLLFDILSFEVYCRSFTAFFLLIKTGRHNRTIQKSELKTKKQDRTIKESELKTNRHNRPIQKSELKTKKQDRKIKESELKTNRYNRPIKKSELGINRLHRPIQSEDRIGIGKSINRTFRPPLIINNWTVPVRHGMNLQKLYQTDCYVTTVGSGLGSSPDSPAPDTDPDPDPAK